MIVTKNTFSTKPKLKYLGYRKFEKKDGFGIQSWQDGAVYQGFFKNDRATGFGRFQHSDGDSYIGSTYILILLLIY